MRRKIILQRRLETADAGGGAALSWIDIAELWARITPLPGSETVHAMQMQATQTYLIRMRYRGDITPADRLALQQRILNIRSVKNVNERSQWLECRCEEGVAG
ncbi:MAG: phage head closure protein [Alphaproteobacteria bacterium]